MGTVYAASDRALERRVAVKVIREDLVGSADAAERFRREARVAASFAHPNVVTVHDFGPGQWRGEEAHPAWDLWALAVVVYEMLTGAYPFDGRSPAEWFGTGAVAKFTPLSGHLPEARRSWQEFFEHAFAYDLARRPQSAETFLSELRRALS